MLKSLTPAPAEASATELEPPKYALHRMLDGRTKVEFLNPMPIPAAVPAPPVAEPKEIAALMADRAKREADALIDRQLTALVRDWPEDFPHENGNYMNHCVHCQRPVHGTQTPRRLPSL